MPFIATLAALTLAAGVVGGVPAPTAPPLETIVESVQDIRSDASLTITYPSSGQTIVGERSLDQVGIIVEATGAVDDVRVELTNSLTGEQRSLRLSRTMWNYDMSRAWCFGEFYASDVPHGTWSMVAVSTDRSGITATESEPVTFTFVPTD